MVPTGTNPVPKKAELVAISIPPAHIEATFDYILPAEGAKADTLYLARHCLSVKVINC